MEELKFVRVYLDDLLVISKGTHEGHLDKLDGILRKLTKVRLKVNFRKTFLACTETKYLGCVITREGTQQLNAARSQNTWSKA